MMGVDKLPSQEEFGRCRSVGSNIHPSSQSQKMSIGIVVDSAYKVRHKADSVAKSSEPVAYHQTPIHQPFVEVIPDKQDTGLSLEKETHIPGQERSPWITIRDKPSALKTHGNENQTSTKFSEAKCKLNGFSRSYSVRPVSENSARRKNQAVNGETMPQGAEEADPNKIKSMSRPSDTLKMKLLEVLGPDTFPDEEKELNENDNQEQTRKAGSVSGIHVNNQKTDSNEVDGTSGNHAETPFEINAKDAAFKYVPNSDPIETDSESPNKILKRPVTRSFKRKSTLPKSVPKKADNGLCHSFQKMNNHTTVQTEGKNWSKEPKSTSLLSGAKRVAMKGARIEPRKISFVEKNDAKKKASTYTKRSAKSHDTAAGLGDKNEGNGRLGSPLNDRDQSIPESRFQDEGFHQNTPVKTTSLGAGGEGHQRSPVSDKGNIIPEFGTRLRGFEFTATKKGRKSTDKSINTKEDEPFNENFTTSKKIFKPRENLCSPIKTATTPVESPSPQQTGKSDQVRGNRTDAVVEENIFMGVKISNLGDWRTSKPKCNSSRLLAESSDDTREKEFEVSPAEKSPTNLKSAPEGCSSDSSEDNSLSGVRFNGFSKNKLMSSPEANSKSPELFRHRGKRPRCHKATTFEKNSKASPPQKDSTYDEDDVFCVPSDQDEDDGLSRAVTMLAVALKKLESKVKSATRKKSFEIMHSTADGLNLQLQNVKSLILRDIEKATSIGKSKRKHMETMFHEQQEQLKIFLDNFEKGFNQHTQHITSTIEEMETYQAEQKGPLEKQKAQHKKILLQFEEEMDRQINDADKRITNVHKVANEKLLQLKYVIAHCLK